MSNARTTAFLVANLGSEVSRLQFAIRKRDVVGAEEALWRAKMIFEKIQTTQMSHSAKAELKILREVVEDLPNQNRRFKISTESLNNYFLPFAKLVLKNPTSSAI